MDKQTTISIVTSTDRDGREQTLGHVRDNDSNEEDDGVEPIVAEDDRDDEERDAKEDRDARDDVDEVFDLARDRRLADLQSARQVRDATHDGAVAGRDHHPATCTCNNDNNDHHHATCTCNNDNNDHHHATCTCNNINKAVVAEPKVADMEYKYIINII